jgi:hypothetical protein
LEQEELSLIVAQSAAGVEAPAVLEVQGLSVIAISALAELAVMEELGGSE